MFSKHSFSSEKKERKKEINKQVNWLYLYTCMFFSQPGCLGCHWRAVLWDGPEQARGHGWICHICGCQQRCDAWLVNFSMVFKQDILLWQMILICIIFHVGQNVRPLNKREYILDITTETEPIDSNFSLWFRRVIWTQPLKFDNELSVSMHYNQVAILGALSLTHASNQWLQETSIGSPMWSVLIAADTPWLLKGPAQRRAAREAEWFTASAGG